MAEPVKERLNAPCAFLDDEGKKRYPAVDCNMFCEACGWNPAEAKRRKQTGKWHVDHKHMTFQGRFS